MGAVLQAICTDVTAVQLMLMNMGTVLTAAMTSSCTGVTAVEVVTKFHD